MSVFEDTHIFLLKNCSARRRAPAQGLKNAHLDEVCKLLFCFQCYRACPPKFFLRKILAGEFDISHDIALGLTLLQGLAFVVGFFASHHRDFYLELATLIIHCDGHYCQAFL